MAYSQSLELFLGAKERPAPQACGSTSYEARECLLIYAQISGTGANVILLNFFLLK